MISQAYIFGTLGKAAFKQNEKWYVLDNNDPNTIRDWHTFDKNYLVLSNPEIVDLPQGKNLDDLRQLLALETTKQEALTLALQLMDESIPQEDIKTEIAELLGEYSQNSSIFQFLENRLLTTILPNSFSPSFAFNVCHSLQLHEIARMYELLTICSPEIQTFYTAWIKISKDYFQNAEKGDTAFRLLTTHGVAKAFVQSIVRQEKGIWDKAALDAALILQKEGLSANAMSFFMRLKTDLTQHFKIEFKEKISSLIDTEDNGDEIATIIETYLDNFFDERSGKKKGTNKNKKSNHARWEAVQSNVEFSAKRILNNLQEDNMAGARACLKDLISNQVKTSAPEHICKSLTNIASSLLSNSITSFTKTLLGYARILNSDDSVVYSLGAEVLKAEGNLSEAKSEYQRIKKQFPNDVVAQTGYAEILKAEGNLTEAKSEYQRIKKQFPSNVVAQNGYAEILKAEGNLAEAKTEYQRIKKQFPNDVFAQNGYAEILKAEGNLTEAKSEYQRIKKQFPNDAVAQNGYAEILKAEGNLAEAKTEYQRIKKQFLNNVVAQTGHAEILKAEGKISEAKEEYQRIKKQFPSNVVAQNGYAEILKAEGNLSEAKSEYQRIKKQFPSDVVAQNGYAEILKAEGKITEAKAEYQRIVNLWPNNQVALHALNSLLLVLGEPVTNVPPIPTAPQTSHDFYWLYFYTTKLIKEEHLVEAKRLAVLGMENCNFYELKLLFKRTKNYISLQLRDFDAAIADLHEYMEQHPIDHVLQTHAYAELNQQESARVELKKTMQFRGIPIIYDIACLLSEKYSINGLPKSNLPPDELTKRIREYEYQALVLI